MSLADDRLNADLDRALRQLHQAFNVPFAEAVALFRPAATVVPFPGSTTAGTGTRLGGHGRRCPQEGKS